MTKIKKQKQKQYINKNKIKIRKQITQKHEGNEKN
jgi:hypothetical protein